MNNYNPINILAKMTEVQSSLKLCEFLSAKKLNKQFYFYYENYRYLISVLRINGGYEILQLEGNTFMTNNEYVVVKIEVDIDIFKPKDGEVPPYKWKETDEIQIDLILDKSLNAYQSGIITIGYDYDSFDATRIGILLDYTLTDLAAKMTSRL